MKLIQSLSKNNTLIKDGGFATTLEDLGCDINSSLWSAGLLKTNPEVIKKAHDLFLKAGADIILTNTYQAAFPSFRNAGINSDEINPFMKNAVEAVKECEQNGSVIVGSLGPYAALLTDGSEYTGDYSVTPEDYFHYHKERIESLIDLGMSDFTFEAVPNFEEIKALTETVIPYFQRHDLSFWLSCTVTSEGDLPDGTAFSKVCEYISLHTDEWSIFGINCSSIKGIEEALKKGLLEIPQYTALYPNGGKTYDAATKTWSGTDDSELLIKTAPEWKKAGVNIIGGCCGILPDDIKKLTTVINTEN